MLESLELAHSFDHRELFRALDILDHAHIFVFVSHQTNNFKRRTAYTLIILALESKVAIMQDSAQAQPLYIQDPPVALAAHRRPPAKYDDFRPVGHNWCHKRICSRSKLHVFIGPDVDLEELPVDHEISAQISWREQIAHVNSLNAVQVLRSPPAANVDVISQAAAAMLLPLDVQIRHVLQPFVFIERVDVHAAKDVHEV